MITRLLRISAIAAGLTMVLATMSIPASAATANAGVYGIAPQSAGWCPKGPGLLKTNKVTEVWYVNHTTGKQGRDGGDDIIWIPVRTGTSNSISFGVRCRWNTPQGSNYTIRPSRNKQSWWFTYPAGARSN
jgi:hypothetical protein